MPVESLTGSDLANTVLKGLEECGLDPTHIRCQGYDGASSMSGTFKGVQACIQKKHPTALYVHCASHSLNLAITNSAEVPSIRNCFGTIEKIWSFFNTPKRQNVLQRFIENDTTLETKKKKLKQLCPTRWVQRHDAVFIMKEMFRPVAAALDEIKSWDDKDTSSTANNLLIAVGHSEFLVSLVCTEKLLSYTLKVCKKLLPTDADLLSAVDHTETVLSRVVYSRKCK
uniref:52 kDa repressor of the inhibitor of the protein kinase n=1 Tax=Lygus hesperus TaxID=30085 RepID=A0A0A9W4J5_LYGHE